MLFFNLFHLANVFSKSLKRDDSVIFILCKNDDLKSIKESIESLERTFNSEYNYPYVFMNDKPWSQEFMDAITNHVNSEVTFDVIKSEDWNMPQGINIEKAHKNWEDMNNKRVPYANMESYHNMCRFFSRAFYNQDVVKKYKYYWRVEPGVKFHCKLKFDPFQRMAENGWKYGFNITIGEYMQSIPTLGDVTNDFISKNLNLIQKSNRLKFMFDSNNVYNGCHFWSNFEIGSFDFLRSPEYQAYVNHLEKSGGFYYERWGDAPVHSLAVSLFLEKDQVHFFDEIGYTHPPFTHCPVNNENCDCKVKESVDFVPGSCLKKYYADQNA